MDLKNIKNRIQELAQHAHEIVESTGWQPALVILQNKWTRAEGEEVVCDITSEYGWLVEGLPMFLLEPLQHPPPLGSRPAR